MANLLGIALTTIGLSATVLGVVGVWRMPHFFLRMKPFSLATTIGGFSLHLGLSLMVSEGFGYKGVLTALLFLITGPALGQALMFTAHALKVPDGDQPDELRGAEEVELELSNIDD